MPNRTTTRNLSRLSELTDFDRLIPAGTFLEVVKALSYVEERVPLPASWRAEAGESG